MLDSFHSELEVKPLHRVAVKDGLLLTAELWQQAHSYHRQKQNLFYQSFHTPGIVAGLGVSVIQPPRDIPAQYRDFRWLRIQSGIAIDARGNVIVVPQPLDFRIASIAKEKALTVYLIISYVDPENLQTNSHQDIITETFRVDEKINLPSDSEIELCRILLQPSSDPLAQDNLTNAIDLLNPEPNSLDLRYRRQAGIRPQKVIRIGQVINSNSRVNQVADNFANLGRSLSGMYPQMWGYSQIIPIDLKPNYSEKNDLSQLVKKENISIIYLDYQQAKNLSREEIEILKLWIQSGSTLLIEYLTKNTKIGELKFMQQQLIEVTNELETKADTVDEGVLLKDRFKNELKSLENLIKQESSEVVKGCQKIGQMLAINTNSQGTIERNHLVRNHPFLFARFPLINKQLIDIFNWQNLVLVIGNLTDSWGLDENLVRHREDIRTSQEMGINLLNFAWEWHHMQSLYDQNK